MKYTYLVTSKKTKSDPFEGPHAFFLASILAHFLVDGGHKEVRILRADQTGVNAGKFLLKHAVN